MLNLTIRLWPQRARPPEPHERRTWERYRYDQETFCQPTDAGEDELWWQGRVHNLSAGGMGLLLTRRFEPGTVLTIELPGTRPGASVHLLARVIRASRCPGTDWLIGCVFDKELSDDELQSLLAAARGM